MNALHIHVGEEYAAMHGKPRGNALVLGARRIKVMRVFGAFEFGKTRETNFVEGFQLDAETGDIVSTTYVKYRARDVIQEWDEYYDLVQQHEVEVEKARAERAERQRQYELELEERNRQRRLREAEEARRAELRRLTIARKRDEVKRALSNRGISVDAIKFDSYAEQVVINLDEIIRWLGIPPERLEVNGSTVDARSDRTAY